MAATNCPKAGCTFVVEAGVEPAMAVALMTGHINMDHSRAAQIKPSQIPRPELVAGETTKGWQYFLHRWQEYSEAANLTGSQVNIQLLACLDTKLRKDVTMNAIGPKPIKDFSEEELLRAIRTMAVQEENRLAARLTLSRMTQDRGESVWSFVSRLRSQADICRFDKKCSGCATINSQGDNRVADQLCIGLADTEVLGEILKLSDIDRPVEELAQFIETRVAGKRSLAAIHSPSSTETVADDPDQEEAVASAYQQQRRPPAKPKFVRPQTQGRSPAASSKPLAKATPLATGKTVCHFCGKTGHGSTARTAVRRVQCPAFGSVCASCGRPNHYTQMCWQTTEHENAIEDTVLSMTEDVVAHQSWDINRLRWVQERSPPQPTLEVTISTHREDYNTHGQTLPTETAGLVTTALADTGCQSCLAGPDLMRKLNLTLRDLVPAALAMNTADGTPLPITGAAFIRLKHSPSNRETRQMLYFSKKATKLYLSMTTCQHLGLVKRGFPSHPTPPTMDQQASITTTRQPANPVSQPTPKCTPAQVTPRQAKVRVTPPTTKPCSCPIRSPPPDRLQPLPFPATEANRKRLEQHLLDRYASSAFNVCEHQPLPMMSGPPLHLNIDPAATPKPCHTPITVPVHWQEEVKAGLDRDVRLGVLEKVPLGTPVTWCHRMVICTKKNGSLRRTINFQPLNKHATRETHHCPSPFHQARAVPRNTKKTIFDAWNGYHSVALREEDRHLTTFITPWGRYRYLTAPQGYIASGDAYTSRYDALVAHIEAKTKCVDDALLWSSSIEEAFHQATEWLDICAKNGITLNPTKFRFAQDQVEFAGFTVTATEVRPADKFTSAIQEFPTPSNLTDVRAWFGLVNQVSYTFAMTATMLPFRELLSPSVPFKWTPELERAFHKSKEHICSGIKRGVEIFDKGRPTCLTTDWSKHGIGYWLTQKHCQCPSKDPFCCQDGWRITLVGSRYTHSAESRYAPVEGEALAVADALDKTRHFVLGCSDLIVAVDHKPLLKLFGDRCLEDIPNPRLRNIKEKTLRYRFRLVYVPGPRNLTSDALSRHPSGDQSPTRMHLQDDVPNPGSECPGNLHSPPDTISTLEDEEGLHTALCAAISFAPIGWEALQIASSQDPEMRDLSYIIEEGPPADQQSIPTTLKAYKGKIKDMTCVDGVVCLGERIVVPLSLRQTCLDALHAAHQGISGMTARATSSIFWPGITRDISSTRSNCRECNGNAPSQPRMPPVTPETSDYPFQHLCGDFFHHAGHSYLVLVDRYSGWPIVAPASKGATGLATVLTETFSTYGIPSTVTTDGGPEFVSHTTKTLLASWGVQHRISAPYNPHANNRAETGVKTTKRLIAGNTDPGGRLGPSFHKALLTYRNSPSPDTAMSPAMCIFGRPTRDLLPTLPAKLQPPNQDGPQQRRRTAAMQRRQSLGHERWNEHSRGLSPLKQGDRVHVQNMAGHHPTKWDNSGIITEVLQYHQYTVLMDHNGRSTTRNRRHLRRDTSLPTTPSNPLDARLRFLQIPRAAHQPAPEGPPLTPPQAHPPGPTAPATPATPTHPRAPTVRQQPPTPTGFQQQTSPIPRRSTPPPTPASGRSYATVAGTPKPPPPRVLLPPPNTSTPKHTTPAPIMRRSQRTRPPIVRYGQQS